MTTFSSPPSVASPPHHPGEEPILAGTLERVALRLLDPTASRDCRGSWAGRIPEARHAISTHCD